MPILKKIVKFHTNVSTSGILILWYDLDVVLHVKRKTLMSFALHVVDPGFNATFEGELLMFDRE